MTSLAKLGSFIVHSHRVSDPDSDSIVFLKRDRNLH
jgi:hypothetical protein